MGALLFCATAACCAMACSTAGLSRSLQGGFLVHALPATSLCPCSDNASREMQEALVVATAPLYCAPALLPLQYVQAVPFTVCVQTVPLTVPLQYVQAVPSTVPLQYVQAVRRQYVRTVPSCRCSLFKLCPGFTVREGRLAFLWARMRILDDTKSFKVMCAHVVLGWCA